MLSIEKKMTMSKERSNSLAMLSIEKKMIAELDYKYSTETFVHQKAKRII